MVRSPSTLFGRRADQGYEGHQKLDSVWRIGKNSICLDQRQARYEGKRQTDMMA
jgi:hypothetical protein